VPVDLSHLLLGGLPDAADSYMPNPGSGQKNEFGQMAQVGQATGSASPSHSGSPGNRPQQPYLEGSMGFETMNNISRWEPPQNSGPPYAVKDAAFYAVKTSDHAHERIVERTPLPAKHIERLQQAVDLAALPPEDYYVPLRKDGNVVGYAAFKGVPNRKHPVLATVLSPWMNPRGKNIEKLIKTSVAEPQTNATPYAQELFTTDQGLDPRPPESTANRVVQPIAGNQMSDEQSIHKLFNDLLQTETNTIDTANFGFTGETM
jgi:hypothetical protein